MMEGTQLAAHGSAAEAAVANGTGQAPCPDEGILEGQGTMVVHHDVPAIDGITGMLNGDGQASDPALPNDKIKALENGRATRHRPASQSEDGSSGMSHTQVSAVFNRCATLLDSAAWKCLHSCRRQQQQAAVSATWPGVAQLPDHAYTLLSVYSLLNWGQELQEMEGRRDRRRATRTGQETTSNLLYPLAAGAAGLQLVSTHSCRRLSWVV